MSVNIQTSDGLVKIAGTPTIDTSFSNISKNPVQNNVITQKFEQIDSQIRTQNSNFDTLEYSDIAGGKNLANINDFKALTSNPSRYGYEWLNMKGGTYTFNITNGNSRLYIGYKHNEDFVNPSSVINNSIVQTITISDGDNIVIWYDEGVTENTVTKIQLEVGSVATEYEPYIPSVKMLAEENAQQNTETMDLKMLGWTVPSECPVQNYIDSNGVFHQKVGRVDLGSKKYAYNGNGNLFYSDEIIGAKPLGQCVYQKFNGVTGSSYEKDWGIALNDTIYNVMYINAPGYTDPATLNHDLTGIYLYYELAEEKTISVDGNEAVTKVNESLEAQGLIGSDNIEMLQGFPSNTDITQTFLNDNYVCSKEYFECNAGDKITIHNENSGKIVFFTSAKGELSEADYPCVAPTNAKYFRLKIGYKANITPTNCGNVSVYINNAIDEIKNDFIVLEVKDTIDMTANRELDDITSALTIPSGYKPIAMHGYNAENNDNVSATPLLIRSDRKVLFHAKNHSTSDQGIIHFVIRVTFKKMS